MAVNYEYYNSSRSYGLGDNVTPTPFIRFDSTHVSHHDSRDDPHKVMAERG